MHLLLAVALAASPLPKEVLPIFGGAVSLPRPGPVRPAGARVADEFFRAVAGLPGMQVVMKNYPHGTEEVMDRVVGKSPDMPPAQLSLLGTTQRGGCVLWFASFSDPGPDTFSTELLLITARADRVPIDGGPYAFTGGSAGTGQWAGRYEVTANGELAAVQEYRYIDEVYDNLPGKPKEVVRRTRTPLTVGADCKVTQGSEVSELLSGHLRDVSTGEELWLADDGRKVQAWYSGKDGAPFKPLTTDGVDRKAGRLTVRFKGKAQPYPLEWDAARTRVRCTNPDGGIQVFEDLQER